MWRNAACLGSLLALPQTHVQHLLAARAHQGFGGKGHVLLQTPLFLVAFSGEAVALEETVADYLVFLATLRACYVALADGAFGIHCRAGLCLLGVHDVSKRLHQLADIGCNFCCSHGAHACLCTSNFNGLLHDVRVRHVDSLPEKTEIMAVLIPYIIIVLFSCPAKLSLFPHVKSIACISCKQKAKSFPKPRYWHALLPPSKPFLPLQLWQ